MTYIKIIELKEKNERKGQKQSKPSEFYFYYLLCLHLTLIVS